MRSPYNQRIIFVPFVDAFGGVERLVLDLSRFLFDVGQPHVIVSFRQKINLQSYADWPLQLRQLQPYRNAVTEAHALNKFLESACSLKTGRPLLFDLKSAFYAGIRRPRAFVLHLTDPPSLLPADISKYAYSARDSVSGFQNGHRSQKRALRGELVHRLNSQGMRRASRVIVMTERIREELRSLYGVESLVIRPGVSANSHERKLPKSGRQPLRMLSVSRLEPSKRIDWILKALATMDNQTSSAGKWRFDVIGKGPEMAALKALAADLGVADRTSFLGHVSDEELAKAYLRADLFLMPAMQGYGLPALEALSRGIPAIVHRDSGVSEILDGSPWIEVVDGQSEGLSTAIRNMFERLNISVFQSSVPPELPSNTDWARTVCHECGWMDVSTN